MQTNCLLSRFRIIIVHLLGAVVSRRYAVVPHSRFFINSTFQVETGVVVPRFDPGLEALEYLTREGYVVLRSVLNVEDLSYARSLFWSFLEGIGVDRENPMTWAKVQPNPYGIVWGFGSGQSRFMWHIRTRPRLLEMFERFWNTSDLIASFEGFSMFPPREVEPYWDLGEAWFHTDQNGVSRPGQQTIQSLTLLYDQDESSGGFIVVPRSHRQHNRVTKRVYKAAPHTSGSQQFLMLPPNDPILFKPHPPHFVRSPPPCRHPLPHGDRPLPLPRHSYPLPSLVWLCIHLAGSLSPGKLVVWDRMGSSPSSLPRDLDTNLRAKAGDAIIWDSRTVHCSTPPLGEQRSSTPPLAAKRRDFVLSQNQDGSIGLPEMQDFPELASVADDDSQRRLEEESLALLPPHETAPRPTRVAAYCAVAPRARATDEVLRLRQHAMLIGQT